MPNAWTTVYKLASLKNDEFDRVTKSESFTPFMTAEDINLIVNGPKPKTEHHRDLIMDLSGLDQTVKIDLYPKVKALEEQFKFGLRCPTNSKHVPTTRSLIRCGLPRK